MIMLLPLAIIGERLHYGGRDRERSVKRLFRRYGVPMIRRGRSYFVTEQQYVELIEKMTCLPSGAEARISTSGARSVWGGKRVSSKNILAERLAETTRRSTAPKSRPRSGTKSFTVLVGGRIV
jgi:tRNA(Ile)-lysidine synthetase-like protein